MYSMCVLKIPITIFVHFEKSGWQFLWAKKETDKHGKCLAKWELVCRPKDQGGLGVLNLRLQNQALLMKNLYKFYNQHDIPWVQLIWRAYQYNNTTPHSGTAKGSFWWRDCLSLMEKFKELTTCNIGSGKSISLWTDKWGRRWHCWIYLSTLTLFCKGAQ
jgi:hypothetical protein